MPLKASFLLQRHGANVDQPEAFLQLEDRPWETTAAHQPNLSHLSLSLPDVR